MFNPQRKIVIGTPVVLLNIGTEIQISIETIFKVVYVGTLLPTAHLSSKPRKRDVSKKFNHVNLKREKTTMPFPKF